MVGEMVKEGIRRWKRWSYYIIHYKLADIGKKERIARETKLERVTRMGSRSGFIYI